MGKITAAVGAQVAPSSAYFLLFIRSSNSKSSPRFYQGETLPAVVAATGVSVMKRVHPSMLRCDKSSWQRLLLSP
eukprot:scaffold43616_cov30-Tisochrysis_lutea.AAC.2